eukprot:1210826-Pleurochrysis_carterae.AAC.1
MSLNAFAALVQVVSVVAARDNRVLVSLLRRRQILSQQLKDDEIRVARAKLEMFRDARHARAVAASRHAPDGGDTTGSKLEAAKAEGRLRGGGGVRAAMAREARPDTEEECAAEEGRAERLMKEGDKVERGSGNVEGLDGAHAPTAETEDRCPDVRVVGSAAVDDSQGWRRVSGGTQHRQSQRSWTSRFYAFFKSEWRFQLLPIKSRGASAKARGEDREEDGAVAGALAGIACA